MSEEEIDAEEWLEGAKEPLLRAVLIARKCKVPIEIYMETCGLMWDVVERKGVRFGEEEMLNAMEIMRLTGELK